jgi:hypothetical protein
MKRLFLLFLVCGCGSPVKMVAGQPAAFVQSDTQNAATMAPANFGCLGTHVDPAAPTAATPLMVHVKDFEKKTAVMGATVEVYLSLAKFNAHTPDATSAVTDANGMAALMVPPGSYRVIFRTTVDPSVSATVETIEFNRAYNDPERYSVSEATKGTIQAVLSLFPDDTQGVVAGAVRDCDDHDVGGVVFETASSGGAFDNATNTFYFVDVTKDSTVPVRAQKWTSGDGVFASLNVPPGDVTITARGLLTANGALTELGTGLAPVRANSITVVQLEPNGPCALTATLLSSDLWKRPRA